MFIAIQIIDGKEHIAWAADTEEELLAVLTDAVGYQIEETEETYIFFEGQFLTQAQIDEIEKERIGELFMTRGDFFEGMLYAQQKGKAELRELIAITPLIPDIQKPIYLNRFDEALNYYRRYPIFDLLCPILNIPSDNLDEFFKTKDWHYLVPVLPPEPEELEEEVENTDTESNEETDNDKN
ncbi:MAG: hypothetical protein IJH34_08935 [Romboutsia sp.]|nr:hypothetical protein [Romboutsia sp.]